MRIGVLTNLRAGRNGRRVGRVLQELARHRDVIRRETDSNRAVPDAVAEFAAEGVDLLVLNGGDGTVHRAVTEILNSRERAWRPMLAPVRCGRTNMIALDLGARRDALAALRGVLAAARAGRLEERIVERPALAVDLGEAGPRYGMFFGAGVLYRAIQLTHRSFPTGRAQGVFGAALVTATLFARMLAGDHGGVLDPDKMQIALDRTPAVPEEFTLVMATTLERLFLRLRPFWGAEAAPIHVTMLAAGAQGLARALPALVRGRATPSTTPERGYTSRNVREAALHLDCGLTLDGELFEPEPGRVVRVRASEPIRFVRT